MKAKEMERHIAEARTMAWKAAYRIQRSTGTRLDVEELAAEGMLGLVQAASRFRPDMGAWFKAFARRRVHGALMDRVRADRDWTLRELPEGWNEAPSGELDPLGLVEQKQLHGIVRATVAGLPAGEREAIREPYLRERKQVEIAESLGVDPTRVSQNKRAGLARLRLRLAGLEVCDADE